MNSAGTKNIPWVIYALVALYAVTFSLLSILKHNTLNTYMLDLGVMDQAIWTTLHGDLLYNSALGHSRMGGHVEPILIFLSPLYLLWADPRLLLILQSLVIGLGAIPVYLLAGEKIKDELVAIAFSAAYLLYPALEWANMRDFHAVSLAPTLILFGFYFMLKKKWPLFFIFSFLALSCKEDVSLILFMVGAYIFFMEKERKIGILVSLVSAAWFYLSVNVVMPYFRGTPLHPFFLTHYNHLGIGLGQVFRNMLLRPQIALGSILAGDSAVYFFQMLFPLVFLSVVSPVTLVISLPGFAVNLLSSCPSMRDIYHHHIATVAPVIFISAIFGAHNLMAACRRRFPFINGQFVSALILICSAFSGYWLSPAPWSRNFYSREYRITEHARLLNEVKRYIPPEVSLSLTQNLGPHFSQRKDVYIFPEIGNAEFVLLDLEYADEWHGALASIFSDPRYGIKYFQGGYLVLQKGHRGSGRAKSPSLKELSDYLLRNYKNDPYSIRTENKTICIRERRQSTNGQME